MNMHIFSYAFAREPGERGATFLRFLRRSYFVKALMLLPLLPIDLLLFATTILVAKKSTKPGIVFLTAKFPALVEHELGRGAVFIGPPTWALQALRRNGVYLPASLPYCLLGLVSWRSEAARSWASARAIAFMRIAMNFTQCERGVLLHHSDALPFARCVLAACAELKMKTLCIQHGIFHPSSQISEIEGHLSDLNIARSHEDATMIRAANPHTQILVEPDFFLPAVGARQNSPKTTPRVVLVGEGWHSIDAAFDKNYNDTLRALESDLEGLGCHVIFRPHPSERGFANRMGFKRVDKSPLEECLNEADVVVGYASTVLFEASSVRIAACQVPVQGHFAEGLSRSGVHIERSSDAQQILAFWHRHIGVSAASTDIDLRREDATRRVAAVIEQMRSASA